MLNVTPTLKNILANPNIIQDNNSLKELSDIIIECLQEIGELRKELTQAYIISQIIVIEENGQYVVATEKKIREEQKQSKDINKILRQDEMALKNIVNLLPTSPEKQNIDEHQVKDVNSNSKYLSKFLKKLKEWGYKLLNIFTLGKYNKFAYQDHNSRVNIVTDPAQVIKDSINNFKRYKEEVKVVNEKCQKLEELKQQITRYNSQIKKDPKEYNKSPNGKKLLEILEEKVRSKRTSLQK